MAQASSPMPEELKAFLLELSQRIRAARKKKGLSQEGAAAELKIDYRHYQNIEGGKVNLRLDTLLKLLKFYELGTDLATVVSLTDYQRPQPRSTDPLAQPFDLPIGFRAL